MRVLALMLQLAGLVIVPGVVALGAWTLLDGDARTLDPSAADQSSGAAEPLIERIVHVLGDGVDSVAGLWPIDAFPPLPVAIGAAALAAVVIVRMAIAGRRDRRIREAIGLLQDREPDTMTDGLTALGNRRAFSGELWREASRATRHGGELSLVLIDIDGFGYFNRRWGEREGDRVLMDLARLLNSLTRAEDRAFRVGGDQFALLLPDTPLEEAVHCADRIRRVAAAELGKGATIGAGIASFTGAGGDAARLCADAELALYQVKGAGRNRVVALDPEHRPVEPETRQPILPGVAPMVRAAPIGPLGAAPAVQA